jgi:hypothetical protein
VVIFIEAEGGIVGGRGREGEQLLTRKFRRWVDGGGDCTV